jgi:RNA polymerase sigma factor (sigma-70 family)
MKGWELTGEEFDRFLGWLGPDREQAARRYEAIHRRLIVFFDFRRCANPEDLADETINRIIRRIADLNHSAGNDPILLFYKVAHYVHLDYLKTRVKRDAGPPSEDAPDPLQSGRSEEVEEKESRQRCLDSCLQKLAPDKRDLIIQYYQQDRQAKINHRKSLAEQFGYTANALRIQLHRLRAELHDCIVACLKQEAGRKR